MTDEESIFAEALAQASAAERAAFIEAACAGDTALRAAVEGLLLAHEQAGGILETPAVSLDTTSSGAPQMQLIGSTVGPYRLLEQIGGGGMGVVYMAEQLRPVRRKVALKIIKPGMDSGQVIARFEAERQALTMMDHPNIARVLDAGTTDAGRPYFVMELVKGIPITDYCDQTRLTTRQRLELFIQVCNAVQHAHQKGIIHRDLKPTNVLVTLHDDKPVPKVIDFGIAKATGQQLTERTLFTNYAQMLGTPLYMSPEQAQISGLDVDTRSDVYSLGVLLYELLTGTTPFDKQRLREAAYDEMRRIIREEDPPKPSTRLSTLGARLSAVSAQRHTEPKKLSQLVRGELDWIVMKSLEKERAQRYETANGLGRDVERYLKDEPVHACPPTAGYRLRKFSRRYRRPLAAAVALAAILLATTIFSTWQAIRATRAERLAQLRLEAETAARRDADEARRETRAEAQKAKTEAEIAKAVNDFLNHDLLAQANDATALHHYKELGVELKLLTVLNRAAERIEGRFPDQPLVEAALRHTIGETYKSFSESPANRSRAAKHLQRAMELRRALLGEEHPDTLRSMGSLGSVRGDVDLCDHVLQARRRILGQDHPSTLWSMFSLAYALDRRGEKERALATFRELLEAQRRVLGDDHSSTAWTKHLVACVQRPLDGDVGPGGAHGAEVERLYREALATMLKQESSAAWYRADISLRLGQFLNVPGHYERAETVLQEGYLRLQSEPAAPPEWAAPLAAELESLYRKWGKPQRAADWERKRIAGNELTLRRNVRLLRDHPDEADLLASTATLLFQLHRFSEAEAAYRLALAAKADDPWLHQFFGDACAAQGRFAEAEAAFREAIRLEPNEGGRHHNLALVLQGQRRFAEAAAEFTEAIRLRPEESASYHQLGNVYVQLGEWEKAAIVYEGAATRNENDHWSLFKWATLCFNANAQEEYQRACRAMLERFGQSDDKHIVERTAKACALAPGFGADAEQVMKLAGLAMADTERHPARRWFETTKALVDYRAGRFKAAADMAIASAPSSDDGFHRDALSFSILAMAQHRLGNAEQALAALANAQQVISTKMPTIENGGTFGDDWHDWLHAQILCREAQTLLTEAPAKP